MQFIETRGNDGKKAEKVSFSEAILSPSASFGGLYVPESLPDFDETFIKEYGARYRDLAKAVLQAFAIDVDAQIVDRALMRYERFDDPDTPVPVVKLKEDLYVCELYHGPTRAFKDMALQPFGSMLGDLAQARNEHYLIMAATSGDTGPATLETFKNHPNVKVVCLYPEGGTSDVQRLQMVTEDAPNLKVLGVKGNFDDTQNALKSLLASDSFKAELRRRDIALSAANSVNFGRIIFQIVYHIYSYAELVRQGAIAYGEKIYLVVPSGNFGNALGAYYAKKAGVPIEKILIASNVNNILTEWIETGVYDLNGRRLIRTESPAMDILKSSNIERVLFDLFGADRTKAFMESLAKEGRFALNKEELSQLQMHFAASFSTDAECEAVIGDFAKEGYVMDTHTATCIKAYKTLREKALPTVIYSTAEWTKFSRAVAKALGRQFSFDKDALQWVSQETGAKVPEMIYALFEKPIVHQAVVTKEKIEEEMLRFL